MPELPDVEHFRTTFKRTSLRKTIQDIEVVNGDLLEDVSKSEIKEVLEGDEFVET